MTYYYYAYLHTVLLVYSIATCEVINSSHSLTMVAFSRRTTATSKRGGVAISLIVWSFSIVVVAFYCGILVGMHAVTVPTTSNANPNIGANPGADPLSTERTRQEQQDMEKEIQWRVAQKLKQERTSGGATATSKQSRFPSTTSQLVGAALVDKDEFLERFDVGSAHSLAADIKNSQVYMLYQHKKALPDKMQDQILNGGPLPLLSVDDATQHCESLNVISTKPFAGLKQCVAIVGQYESYHILRWMRNENNEPVNSTKYNLTRTGRGMQATGTNVMLPPTAKSQDINWNQLVSYFSTIKDVKKRLKVVLEELTGVPSSYQARDNVTRPAVIVMVCNLGQADLLINFCCNARAKSLDLSKILVFCTDAETLEIAQGLGLFAFYDENNFKAVPSEEADAYGDKVFTDVMFIKTITVHLVSQVGYDVLFQDVDIVWNKNPLDFFRNNYEQFDIMFQDDGARSVRFAPYAGNTGFYYVRHNPRTKYLLTNLVYIGDQVRRAASHQQGMGIIMSEHAMLFGLKVKTMTNDHNFAGGYDFHRDRGVMKKIVAGEITPVVFHMCWTENRDNKLNFMEQMGMWQVDEKCKTGPKAHSMLKSSEEHFIENCCAKEPIVKCHFSDKPSIIPCTDSPQIDQAGKPFW